MPKPPNPAATPAVSPRRRRWKEAEARAVLAAFAASGSSLTEFARVEGLEPERLRRWQHRLARAEQQQQPAPARPRRKSSAAPVAPALIELRSPPSARRAEAIEVVLASGVTLRVAETIEPAALARLVAALERGC